VKIIANNSDRLKSHGCQPLHADIDADQHCRYANARSTDAVTQDQSPLAH